MNKDAIYKLLGLKATKPSGAPDEAVTERVDAIVSLTEARLKVLLGGADAIPEELGYIVTEVSIARYNRIGSEGANSHNVEGESISWANDDDFQPYADDIAAYLARQKESKHGKVVFI